MNTERLVYFIPRVTHLEKLNLIQTLTSLVKQKEKKGKCGRHRRHAFIL
ncbi:MAG: hypothetical protein ACUVQ5_05030 [Candidatus Methanomethylicaceae archaeon]